MILSTWKQTFIKAKQQLQLKINFYRADVISTSELSRNVNAHFYIIQDAYNTDSERNVIQVATTLRKPQYATIRRPSTTGGMLNLLKCAIKRHMHRTTLPSGHSRRDQTHDITLNISCHAINIHSCSLITRPIQMTIDYPTEYFHIELDKRLISREGTTHKLSVHWKLSNPQAFPLIGLPQTSITEIRWEIRVLA